MEATVGAKPELSLEEILGAAKEMTGLTEMGEPDIHEGLEVLIDSLNREANLRPDGVEAMRMGLIGRVINRIGINKVLTENPEVLDEEIRGPIVIVGLPRTGTSKLHRMLAADPDLQSIPLWRLLNPAPMGPAPEGGEDPRIAIAEQVSSQMKAHFPDFFAGHPMIPRDPDEEAWMQELTMTGYMPHYAAYVPSYRDWASKRDLRPWYEYLRKLLQVFQWEDGSPERQWLIKAPDHLGNLDLLFEAFPGATLVHTHRDPVVAFTSISVLTVASRRMYSDDPHPDEAGRFTLDFWSNHLRRYLELRERFERGRPFVDIPYREVVEDTMGAIERVAEMADLELTDESREAMRAWEADNPQHKHGRHTYELSQVGLEEDEVRAAFSEYSERFGHLL